MSGFSNQTNAKRAERILETLGHLETSALANKAAREERWAILGPVLERMGEITGAEVRQPGTTPEGRMTFGKVAEPEDDDLLSMDDEDPADAQAFVNTLGVSDAPGKCSANKGAPAWALFRDLAEVIDFKDIGPALALLTARMDEALHELKGKG